MRTIVTYIAFVIIMLLAGCSKLPMDTAGEGIDEPPLPSTQSIIPLSIGNHWEYFSTWYDSTGAKIELSNRTLSRTVPGGFIMVNDSTLIAPASYYYTQDRASEYAYKLEWESADSGILVKHVGNGELEKRGLYIIGTYVNGTTSLYDSSLLWLAYPSKKGRVYTVTFPGSDSSSVITMEVLETAAHFYCPISNRDGASPLYFQDSCYLYKESVKSVETYYYYHPKIGCLGFLKYVNGKLVTTYILKTFVNSGYYYE